MNNKFGQYFNFNGSFLILKHIFKNTQPDFKMSSVAKLNCEFLDNNKIKFIIIDKDNTITSPYKEDYFNEEIKLSIQKIANKIGINNILVVSNSQGSSDDTQIESSKNNPTIKFNEKLGLNVFIHGSKKPNINFKEKFNQVKNFKFEYNFSDDRENSDKKHSTKSISSQDVLVIGDRLMIDVYMAKENNFKSLLVKQLTTSGENVMVRLIRKVENLLIK